MDNSILRRVFFVVIAFLFIVMGASVAVGKKPPWAGGPGGNPHDPPVSAPESSAISLIGMGASALAGYYLGRRKRGADDRFEALKNDAELLERQ